MRIGKYGKILHYDQFSLGIGNIQRFTIFEFKPLCGIIINIFNTVDQDRFHSHAFHSWSWMIRGWYEEDTLMFDKNYQYIGEVNKRITKSRIIPRNYIHKIKRSSKNAISVTFEGSWLPYWSEYFDDGRVKVYHWGREVKYDSKYDGSKEQKV